MLRAIRNTFKLLRILITLARNDALQIVEQAGALGVAQGKMLRIFRKRTNQPEGRRLAVALIQLGPSYIKLGQALSTRADLIGEETARELSMLRDKLPPFPFLEVLKAVEEEFGRPLEQLFRNFIEAPVAAASIAQVHRAQTLEGREVAVKVLRPGIEKAFRRDIELFYWIAGLVERNVPSLQRLRPMEVVKTLEDWMKLEMDLRFEAAAASELKECSIADEWVHVPEVDWARTGNRVLTMEWVDGVAISDTAALITAGHNLNAVAERVAVMFYRQVFRDGFFHGDMHPGNLFVDAKGRIALVDFGITGRMDMKNRAFLARVLDAFLREDYYTAAKIHFDEGIVPHKYQVENFALACRSIAKPIVGKPLKEISLARLLAQLFKVSRDFEMVLQPQLLLLQKNMMMMEGIGISLNPNANMWEIVSPMVKDWARKNVTRRGYLKRRLNDTLESMHSIPQIIKSSENLLRQMENRCNSSYLPRKCNSSAVTILALLSAALTTALLLVILQH